MPLVKASRPEHIYLQLARSIEEQIHNGVLKVGDRLPSVRTLCREQGISMSTVLQAYLELEKKALIESRPQSGYYVSYWHRRMAPVPPVTQPAAWTEANEPDEIIRKVYNYMSSKNGTMLSLGVPANDLLPIPRLNKALVQAMRELPGSGTGYDDVQGNRKLRRQVARWAITWQGRLSEDDIVTTAGCMNALSFSLMAVASAGDTIAVESPVYFGILQLARSLGLKVIELPTHPQTGIDIEALTKLVKAGKVQVCLLVSNFNNPLGSCMPDAHKREVVRLLDHYGVPLIEDDLYGDVYFGPSRPKSCKTFDESGNVLWCGSVSKTLAPGYRVGWVAPGRFREKIIKLKMWHSISSTTITQEVIANFLENGRYETHLRRLRQTLQANSFQFIRAISEYFPEGTHVSRPQGGFVLWIELDKRIHVSSLYESALKQKISIAPGRMFTLQDQYHNCMRLSYGHTWNDKMEATLRTLGRLAGQEL
ncbi:PLP-dependent aminotransferase family protein [Flaviaesturariibacter flavus]|uniref:PLP-dependent aminotransferase family protein n=1 Tax=Flaviaesturariibacter flavus TaxID=2502780 RepID=A0A4R1BK72_9BACT|nr:PLP-dependent aminotransferase family protein [Flaviaesturariibacter flavus]TCJ17780.1 PLP-dependent aminotransferase family protein [Flaviaesturariibacter flavus]